MAIPAWGNDFTENENIEHLFQDAGVEGTFVLYDLTEATFIGYNEKRALQQFIPASTFKIANTLIGLEAGAVSSVDEVLPYGGEPQFLKTWENDMGLRDAIKISNVPIYQELARRIGLDRMQRMISKIGYGN
ncbi:MAG: penicillin-binding transpeptidase domain-containing protein, partial [Emcibacteraceae bacterium]|nr:penicillin-binding transpeptidase domain-containing protein [Emcibacteraceae bacterium]